MSKDAPGTPSWEVLAEMHSCLDGHSEHEIFALCLRLALDNLERDNRALRQSMADLCKETEQVKADASRTFIMGPGMSDAPDTDTETQEKT